MKYETAGDPMTGLLWTKKTRQKIADELSKAGIVVSATTVGKILKDLKYSLKCNSKKVAKSISRFGFSSGGRSMSSMGSSSGCGSCSSSSCGSCH